MAADSEFKGPVCAVSHATQYPVQRNSALHMNPLGQESSGTRSYWGIAAVSAQLFAVGAQRVRYGRTSNVPTSHIEPIWWQLFSADASVHKGLATLLDARVATGYRRLTSTFVHYAALS